MRIDRLLRALTLCALCSITTHAASPGMLAGCRALQDPVERLACYDNLADGAADASAVHGSMGLEATVAGVDRDPYGKLVVTLDNGQVWSQLDTRRLRLTSGDAVRIEPAVAGSHLLEKLPDSPKMRVRLETR